jgi:uncharacterized membrane protein YdbT with pleckstrin-like domain
MGGHVLSCHFKTRVITNSRQTRGFTFWPLLDRPLFGGGPLFYVWLRGKNKAYIVTNQRFYVEEGILAKSKKDIPLNKINDIFFTQGIFQRMFDSGNLAIMTGNDVPTKIVKLDCPEQFRESISHACNYKAA